ncbi:ABC transporter permease [Blastococcus mobilis]|uniref:Peptide/nickel transport system permease protein n=1 Tax=Blastococcus mobilis TaxID=1938746 RepID=A0A238UR25_9ACTN|nr:ABC transporter permease [Blastococcus mobilis]SNR24401.1 peptide/nickel transport system permease protein [Blastococcus mobilis]
MGRFLLRRLVHHLVLVFVAVTLAYVLASLALDPRSRYEGRNPPAPPAVIDAQLSEYGVNDEDPLPERYVHWMGGVLRGDFGTTVTGGSINDELWSRALVSLRLLVIGSVLGAAVGVLVGVVSAVKQHSFIDRLFTAVSFFFIATPVFFTAVLLKFGALQVNEAAGETVLFYTGYETPGLEAGFWGTVTDQVAHLILPTLSIALGLTALVSRYQRNAMLDVLNSDFLRTAQAKGLTRRQALYRHGLRTALIPMAPLLAYSFGTLVVGATFTEKIFGWHGMGEWVVDSITRDDINVTATVALFTAVFVLFAALLSDVLHAVLDPRVRVTA